MFCLETLITTCKLFRGLFCSQSFLILLTEFQFFIVKILRNSPDIAFKLFLIFVIPRPRRGSKFGPYYEGLNLFLDISQFICPQCTATATTVQGKAVIEIVSLFSDVVACTSTLAGWQAFRQNGWPYT